MCTNLRFEAIVASNKMTGISRLGEKVAIIGYLPERATDFPQERLESLKTALGADLSIEVHHGRILLEQTVTVASAEGVRRAMRQMADAIHERLDILATVQ